VVDISELATDILDEVLAELEERNLLSEDLTEDTEQELHEAVVSVITDKLEEDKERN
jgi:6-pyruvoyl-tetrahydropterin synthase